MKVLFVYPTPDRTQVYHHGVGCLSATLKKHGHQTSLLLLPAFDRDAILTAVASFGPQIVCVTSATNQIPLCRDVISDIYGSFRLPIVLGGVHASFMPEECLSMPGVMAVCIGEGEQPLLELVDGMESGSDFTGVSNLWFAGGRSYRCNGAIRAVRGEGTIRNPVRPPIEDLDALPFPDREVFLPYSAGEERVDFMASRGCPFHCAYCFHEHYRAVFPPGHRYCRHRSVNNVIEEIQHARALLPAMRRVNFHDDTFNLLAPWVREFAREYPQRIGLPFECSLEAHLADEETVALLAEAGCYHVFIGVETGNEELRLKVLNKKITNEELFRVFGWARKYGLQTTAQYMLGVPCETEATIRESIELARELRPDCCSPTIFYPYPGTDLFELCRRESLISRRRVTSYYYGSILDQPSISRVAVERYRLLFSRLVRYEGLHDACRWPPAAFALGNTLRYLQKLKRIVRAGRSRPRLRPRVLPSE